MFRMRKCGMVRLSPKLNDRNFLFGFKNSTIVHSPRLFVIL